MDFPAEFKIVDRMLRKLAAIKSFLTKNPKFGIKGQGGQED